MKADPVEVSSYIFNIYGGSGTGKTTLALSGEGRKAYMELDIGSLQRAASGLNIAEEDIDYHQYRLPATSLRDRGRVSTQKMGKSGLGAATIVHSMRGWDDLSFRFRNEFCDFCESPDYTDIIVDTGSLCWELLQSGTREAIQKNLPEDQWEKELKRLEFEEPNKQVWDMCNYAKMHGKNLIFTAMERQEWGDGNYIPGTHKPEGARDLPGYCDAVLRMTVANKHPVAEIVKVAAGGYELLGMRLDSPTLGDLIAMFDGAAFIRRKGLPMPSPLTMASIIGWAKEAAEE